VLGLSTTPWVGESTLESNMSIFHSVGSKYYTVERWKVFLESNMSKHEPDPKSRRADYMIRSEDCVFT
jgi:hypothetical protein